MNKFGDNFKKLRNSHHYTQEQIADKFNMTKTGISYWENGKATPSLKMTKEIADFFNVSVSALMGGQKDQNSNIFIKDGLALMPTRFIQKKPLRAYFSSFESH